MKVQESHFEIPARPGHFELIPYFEEMITRRIGSGSTPVRFVVSQTTRQHYQCEIGVVEGVPEERAAGRRTLFDFRRRGPENETAFNVVLLIPTGVGCELGGHAGDANPLARLVGSACDTLITHPNVVNASDLNELPANGLYVEGSALARFLMGTAGLQRVRANRVLAAIEQHDDAVLVHAALNSVAAAQATFGLECPRAAMIDPAVRLASVFSKSGRATGVVHNLDRLLDVLDARRREYDAVAVCTRAAVDERGRRAYYEARGGVVNPWGGVEAIFTHALSTLLDVPTAHAPMFDSAEVAREDLGAVDPRMAAEAISVAFFMCALKGLQRSPRIVTDPAGMAAHGVLTAADVSCLVMPDGCVGLPTLAALEQGLRVIAVRENANIMRNRLEDLPWAAGQLHVVDNYWEAMGVLASIRAGIAPSSVRRPLPEIAVDGRREAQAARPANDPYPAAMEKRRRIASV